MTTKRPDTAAPDPFVRRTLRALERRRGDCAAPTDAINRTFQDIVHQATGTQFAKDHGLSPRVRSLGEWKRTVPIRDYRGFEGYLEQLVSGRQGVLTKGRPYALLRTSGTSGRPKTVPTTRHWRSKYRGAALYSQWGLYFERIGLREITRDCVLDLSWTPTVPTVHRGALPLYNITQRPVPSGFEDWSPPWQDASWFSGPENPETAGDGSYGLLRRLAGRGVRMIVSVNPSKMTSLADCLNTRADLLVRDIHDGTVHGSSAADAPADRGLARRLDAARRKRGSLLLTDLWPRLSLRVCWNSGSAALYQPWLDRIAPGTAQLPFSCTGTEGIVTIPVDGHASAGPLAVDQGIFEFASWDDLDDGAPLAADAPTLEAHELETGGRYRLVMSQANGLYRYDVGDVYEVAGWYGRTPRLEFLGRAGFQSSFTGEKLTDSDIHAAVCRALRVEPSDCPLFTCVPVWGEPPRYQIVVELPTRTGHAGATHLAARLDHALRQVNIEYAEKRRSGRIARTEVTVLGAGAFTTLANRRVASGASPAQLKHQWLQKDSSLLSEIRSLFPHAASTTVRDDSAPYREQAS
ncbi:GH3 auxin-responsive promoter family protein [Streptomyces sp. NPDC047117]|uniref:GH3 auxin-responsive promoter family protein n=1 Tax=Streptomyces sp. NPDC047117 TaxID=3155379 RepID=UPI0033C4D4DA